MSPGRLLGLVILAAIASVSTCKVDAWRYGKQLAEQEREHHTFLTDLANANSDLILAEQGKRLALEQWLAASDQTHYRALTDAKSNQARLRDRLATTDLRLSVLLDTATANGSGGMQPPTSSGGLVHGTARTQLDPAHAQRIIGITDTGDQGLIALQACQAYVREITAVR